MAILVIIVTNFSSLELIFDVKRQIVGHEYKANMKIPNLIKSYDKRMGVEDHHAHTFVVLYATKFGSKKCSDHFHLYTRHGSGKCIDTPESSQDI